MVSSPLSLGAGADNVWPQTDTVQFKRCRAPRKPVSRTLSLLSKAVSIALSPVFRVSPKAAPGH